jgi:hypothetical protein
MNSAKRLASVFLALGVQPWVTHAMSSEPQSAPPARDGNIAILEELESARKERTIAAYDLFIARHPNHPLAATAKCERTHLLKAGSKGQKL